MNELLPGLTNSMSLHPLFVHFPIALWTVACGFCLVGAVGKRDELAKVGRWLLYLGTLSAVVTLVSGFLAADQLGHDSPGHDFVHVHRDFMIAALVCSVVASALALFVAKRESSGSRWAVTVAAVVTAAVATLGADRGAVLVYQYGMGVGEPPPHSGSAHDHGDGHGDAHDDSDAHAHGQAPPVEEEAPAPEAEEEGTTLRQDAPSQAVSPAPEAASPEAEPRPASNHGHPADHAH